MKLTLDLNGAEGNAFHILGLASKYSKQMGKTKEETDKILDDMRSGDYEHLLKVFIKNFGMVVKLKRR